MITTAAARRWKELEDAINASRRLSNMVLSAHVHNYQRIELAAAGHIIPFFVRQIATAEPESPKRAN